MTIQRSARARSERGVSGGEREGQNVRGRVCSMPERRSATGEKNNRSEGVFRVDRMPVAFRPRGRNDSSLTARSVRRAEVGDPGRPRRAGRRVDARSALESRGTLPRGRADANPSRGGEASDATASRARGFTERVRGAKRIIEGIWAGGRADAPLSPYLSVASAAARRPLVRRGTARAYSRFSRARDVRCPPWPNLSSDSNPRPRLPKFRSPRQPDTAPRDVRDRHDRDRVPPRFSPRPCDDARASLGAFDVCAELSGARSRRFSQFFFNVTDRVCRRTRICFRTRVCISSRWCPANLIGKFACRQTRSRPRSGGRPMRGTDESTFRR